MRNACAHVKENSLFAFSGPTQQTTLMKQMSTVSGKQF